MDLKTLFGSAASLVGAGAVVLWRMHESRRPVKPLWILLPPLGMSTGFFMFIRPEMRFPWSWGIVAFILGATVFAIPLMRTSRLERQGDVVMMQRSPMFLVILLVLVAVRFALRTYIDRFISPLETAALFFVLAFGMILRWRLSMWREYRLISTPSAGRSSRSATT